MNEERKPIARFQTIYALIVNFGIILLPFIIVYLTSTPLDLHIEPEYVSGFLTASSILFGLWAVAAGGLRELKSVRFFQRIYYTHILIALNLVIFASGIISVFLSVIGVLSTLLSLCLLLSSFILNCLSLLSFLLGLEFRIVAREDKPSMDR